MPYPTVTILLIIVVASTSGAVAYTNHTVGDAAGWHFNISTNTSAANYSYWAASQKFGLGDYLIFNTISNLTVIQTYNETTYRSCSINDAADNDTLVFFGGTSDFGKEMAVVVPLTIEGPNYYFSDADDGIQCQHGMGFEITVVHGEGLPPNLNQPPPPPYMEPPSANSQSPPPVTETGVVPKSFGGDRMKGSAIATMMVIVLSVLLA